MCMSMSSDVRECVCTGETEVCEQVCMYGIETENMCLSVWGEVRCVCEVWWGNEYSFPYSFIQTPKGLISWWVGADRVAVN